MPAVGCRLTKSSWRVGGIGDVGLGRWLGVTGFSLRRGRVGQPDSTVHLQVFFGASRAVAFAGFVIAQAGQIVAVADTVTISGRGCCFDRDEGHTASNERSSVQYGWYAGQVQTRNCGRSFWFSTRLSTGAYGFRHHSPDFGTRVLPAPLCSAPEYLKIMVLGLDNWGANWHFPCSKATDCRTLWGAFPWSNVGLQVSLSAQVLAGDSPGVCRNLSAGCRTISLATVLAQVFVSH
jgi:hypothetical protein